MAPNQVKKPIGRQGKITECKASGFMGDKLMEIASVQEPQIPGGNSLPGAVDQMLCRAAGYPEDFSEIMAVELGHDVDFRVRDQEGKNLTCYKVAGQFSKKRLHHQKSKNQNNKSIYEWKLK